MLHFVIHFFGDQNVQEIIKVLLLLHAYGVDGKVKTKL